MTVFLFHYQNRNSSYINPCIQMYPVQQNYTISISFMSFPMVKKGKKNSISYQNSVPNFVPALTTPFRLIHLWDSFHLLLGLQILGQNRYVRFLFFSSFFGKEMLRRAENTYAHPLRSVALSSLLGSCNTCKDQKRNCGLHWICWALFELALCEVA